MYTFTKTFFNLVIVAVSGLILMSSTPIPSSTLRGRVLDGYTPMEGVKITVLSTSPKQVIYSDDMGKFKVSDLPRGLHTLNITKAGYQEVYLEKFEIKEETPAYLVVKMKKIDNVFSILSEK